jgi:hypothetical protein
MLMELGSLRRKNLSHTDDKNLIVWDMSDFMDNPAGYTLALINEGFEAKSVLRGLIEVFDTPVGEETGYDPETLKKLDGLVEKARKISKYAL